MNNAASPIRNAGSRGVGGVVATFPAGLAALMLALAAVIGPVRSGVAQPVALVVPSSRWLIVIETSSAMHSRAKAVQQVAGKLIASGMNGQMRQNDTVGIWTFNEEVHSGELPLMAWSPAQSGSIASRVFSFLKDRKYEQRSRLDKVLPAIQRIIKDSDYITVLLISSGRDKIQGTPFDDKINAMFESWQKDEEKTGFPFVTALRAERGTVVSYSVTVPPWPLELPPLAPGLLRALKLEASKPSPPPPPPPVMAQPLILSGKKPEPAPAEKPSEASVTNAPLPPAVLTNPTPAPEPATVARTPAMPAPPPAVEIPPVEAPRTVKPAATVISVTNLPAAASPPAASRPVPAAAVPPPAPIPASNTAPSSAFAQPPPSAAAAAEPTAVSQEPAVKGTNQLILILGMVGLVLAGVVLGVLLVLVRQARASGRVSLITRSLERDSDRNPPPGTTR